ncbi:MAG TPA: cation transporter [Actinomycetota bacterium]
MKDRSALLKSAVRVSALSTFVSLTLAVAAIALALGSSSLALLAFGLESLVDGSASAILVWRFGAEGRIPERGSHVESRARRVVGVVLLVVGLYLLGAAVRSLIVGARSHPSTEGILVTAAALLVLPALAYRKLVLARGLGSRALRADGLLTAGGAALAAVTLLAVVVARYVSVAAADPAAAIIVGVVLLREAVAALMEAN